MTKIERDPESFFPKMKLFAEKKDQLLKRMLY